MDRLLQLWPTKSSSGFVSSSGFFFFYIGKQKKHITLCKMSTKELWLFCFCVLFFKKSPYVLNIMWLFLFIYLVYAVCVLHCIFFGCTVTLWQQLKKCLEKTLWKSVWKKKNGTFSFPINSLNLGWFLLNCPRFEQCMAGQTAEEVTWVYLTQAEV